SPKAPTRSSFSTRRRPPPAFPKAGGKGHSLAFARSFPHAADPCHRLSSSPLRPGQGFRRPRELRDLPHFLARGTPPARPSDRPSEFVGSRFELRPNVGRFVCDLVRIVHLQELVIHYVEGVYRGSGIWTLEPTDGGGVLCYRIDLEPQGWLPR